MYRCTWSCGRKPAQAGIELDVSEVEKAVADNNLEQLTQSKAPSGVIVAERSQR